MIWQAAPGYAYGLIGWEDCSSTVLSDPTPVENASKNSKICKILHASSLKSRVQFTQIIQDVDILWCTIYEVLCLKILPPPGVVSQISHKVHVTSLGSWTVTHAGMASC